MGSVSREICYLSRILKRNLTRAFFLFVRSSVIKVQNRNLIETRLSQRARLIYHADDLKKKGEAYLKFIHL